MRATKVMPDGETCAKYPRRTMSREWRRAAFDSREFSRSGGRWWRRRRALRRQSVEPNAVRRATSPGFELAAAPRAAVAPGGGGGGGGGGGARGRGEGAPRHSQGKDTGSDGLARSHARNVGSGGPPSN